MAIHHDDTDPVVISDDHARGGVTEHNVRYVLAFSMTGLIAAFAAVALYEGYGAMEGRLASALTHNPSEMIQTFAPYAAIVLVGAIATGLLLGLWSLIAGRSDDDSQRFMRFRVVAQFALICVIMAIWYVSSA